MLKQIVTKKMSWKTKVMKMGEKFCDILTNINHVNKFNNKMQILRIFRRGKYFRVLSRYQKFSNNKKSFDDF